MFFLVFDATQTWIQSLTLSLSSSVTPAKLLNLSEPCNCCFVNNFCRGGFREDWMTLHLRSVWDILLLSKGVLPPPLILRRQ